jgi:hypothetical protein
MASIEESLYKKGIANYGRMGFSGCDINAIVRLPAYSKNGKKLNDEKVFNIGTLQTISVSTYNSKTPVKSLGQKGSMAIARGGRTIAGTMIFNQMHTHILDENTWPSYNTKLIREDGFLTYSSGYVDYIIAGTTVTAETTSDKYLRFDRLKKEWDFSWDSTLIGEKTKPSDLPPFDIVILMVNELGHIGKIVIYGVDIIHDSQTLSVEDIYTEVQYQYIARDIEYFHATDFNETKAWKSANLDYKPTAAQDQALREEDAAAKLEERKEKKRKEFLERMKVLSTSNTSTQGESINITQEELLNPGAILEDPDIISSTLSAYEEYLRNENAAESEAPSNSQTSTGETFEQRAEREALSLIQKARTAQKEASSRSSLPR